jgi:hypothetical protein
MRAPLPNPDQLPLFWERIETVWLPDVAVDLDDTSFAMLTGRPSGAGWRPLPLARQRQRHSGWVRRIAIPRAPRRASRGGGGWRR